MPASRWELLRGLGAALLTPPPGNAGVLDALGLPRQTGSDHTAVFVLSAPPYAAIHLGPEGQLGGEGLDRVAGFWRVLGLTPPPDADHLGVLLLLRAELGEAAERARADRTRTQLERAGRALRDEHIDSWAPGYLAAVAGHDRPSVTAWTELAAAAVAADDPGAALPAALRDAPDGLTAGLSTGELLDRLVAPIRTGFVLTRPDLDRCAAETGLGLRRGERRFALKAFWEQDPVATRGWLADHADSWARWHGRRTGVTARWWAARAADSARALRTPS